MWIYQQSTGRLTRDGELVAIGYSGHDIDKNVAAAEGAKNMGPLPRGLYSIGEAYTDPHLGPLAMQLTPDASDEMLGRAGFFIHGDSVAHPGDASEGCIVLPSFARQLINADLDRRLQVVA